ncbi:sigma-54-dependent transcriptional regulator [Bythopirellula goksoeyrii]|uniref:DNA-binding transcriptional regulator NtrC n=1 Tax=Bythopirellula goksoeyrii TaxID=1400387 RepID=A0A5B9QIR1_9BACT|nr:sigma-54 dependent transcriptional regulator [Bythopirellula goksoeyrii]QEG36916.1 Nitrogen regulation protein NR(I) [Bythopirellula goksoeyrii]
MPKLLSIDDDRSIHHLIRRALEELDLDISSASTAEEALASAEQSPPDVAVLDVVLPDMSGMDLFAKLKELDPRMPVIIVTAVDTSEIAIEAMKLGAFDYLPKPIDVERLLCMVEQALESRRMMTVPVAIDQLLTPAEKHDAFVGRSESMQHVFKAIGRVAAQNVTVLIRGESGTGKELVARAIYQHGSRSDGPFLAVNCAALSETLLESELFGHEKGAFTGAHSRRIGKFEQCSGGTIFLDEVGDMTPAVQGKVLRLLQEQKFERVGGNETIETDVRLISATNRDLEEMCRHGEFREDLYYRLNGYTIELPPLKDRGEDRILLIEHFLARLAKELDKEVSGIAPDAQAALLEYDWPGNVRELESVLRRALLYCSGTVLLESALNKELLKASTSPATDSKEAPTPNDDGLARFIESRIEEESSDLYAETLAEMETQLLTILLRHTEGNQSEAARILGITRGSLRNKIRSLGISIDQVVTVAEEDREVPDNKPDTVPAGQC